jgi:hypothetical protein
MKSGFKGRERARHRRDRPPQALRDEIAARLAAAEDRRDVPPAKWRSVTPV